ncbi:hypothetical protein TNCV_2280871 [Trichonephila clavipes]|nr:hypothetical protein TNCV_2280871 [Trichonephila clavipes]
MKLYDKREGRNREGSLGHLGFVTPVSTKDSKPLGKRKRSLGQLGIVTPVLTSRRTRHSVHELVTLTTRLPRPIEIRRQKYGTINYEDWGKSHGTKRRTSKFEYGRGSIIVKVWLVTSSNPVPLKTYRVGEQCTLNPLQTIKRPVFGVVGEGRGARAQVSSSALDHVSKLRDPSPNSNMISLVDKGVIQLEKVM